MTRYVRMTPGLARMVAQKESQMMQRITSRENRVARLLAIRSQPYIDAATVREAVGLWQEAEDELVITLRSSPPKGAQTP